MTAPARWVLAGALALAVTFGVPASAQDGGGAGAVEGAAGQPPSSVGIADDVVHRAEQSIGIVDVGGGMGTGWVAGPGTVVTDHHVANRGTNQSKFRPHGTDRELSCYTVIADTQLDISVLRCTGIEATPLQLRADTPPIGTPIFVVGYPYGQYAATGGVVTSHAVEALGASRLGHSAYTRPGSSGSPVLDAEGRVVSAVIGFSGATTVGSHAAEIRPLVDRALGAPGSLQLAVLQLALRRAAIPALVALVVAAAVEWRRGVSRLALRVFGWVMLPTTIIAVFTAIQLFSTGAPVFVG